MAKKTIKLFGVTIYESNDGSTTRVNKLRHNLPVNPPTLPGGRKSVPPPSSNPLNLGALNKQLNIVKPEFIFESINTIRRLVMVNPDLSQAVDNIVSLANTGHQVKFDAEVSEKQANLMRRHLDTKKHEWAEGTAGMDGLVNKMIAQILIGGALSNEWVPNFNLNGIDKIALVNPEEIRFVYNRARGKYHPYQKIDAPLTSSKRTLIKLNLHTYRYYAVNGDTEIPYGIPPYLCTLDSIETQRNMNDNIKFIVEQLGLVGFLEMLMEAPDIQGDQDETKYQEEVQGLLDRAKVQVQAGMRDGVIVGVKDDHEFKFHSFTKDARGVSELWNQNENQIMSGLKQDPALLGRSNGSSDTNITVTFTKLLSQLKNIQNIIKSNLEFGYALELRLAGFNFSSLTVEFKQSTILDELKFQQSKEIKIRNLNALYLDGIISQEQYARDMGYEKPDKPKPRVIRDQASGDAKKKEDREKDKDKSDKKSTEKKNDPNKRSKD